MRLVSVLVHFAFCSVVGVSSVEARTRAPKTDNERSLLYWRYLCEKHPQAENVKGHSIELACPSQNWKVIFDGDQVVEVVDHEKK